MSDSERLPRTTQPRQDIPFLYASYRRLTADLGPIDAMAAGLTMAARYFVDSAKACEDPQELPLELARRYGIPTRYTDLDGLSRHLVRLHLVATSKYLEDFLGRFRREQYAIGRIWRDRRDGESELKYTLDCLPGAFDLNRKRIGTERFELLEYYRLLRNALAHPDVEESKLTAEHEKALRHLALVRTEYGLEAPNDFATLSFDDHLLYTRIVKYVATDLCRLAPPRSAIELKHVLANRAHFPVSPATRLLLRLGDENVLRRALREFFKVGYGFDVSSDETVEAELVTWLMELPRRKQRRRAGDRDLELALANYIRHENDAKPG